MHRNCFGICFREIAEKMAKFKMLKQWIERLKFGGVFCHSRTRFGSLQISISRTEKS